MNIFSCCTILGHWDVVYPTDFANTTSQGQIHCVIGSWLKHVPKVVILCWNMAFNGVIVLSPLRAFPVRQSPVDIKYAIA